MKASHEDTFCFNDWTPPVFEPAHELSVLMAYTTSRGESSDLSRANPGSEFVVANTLAKWKKFEPNDISF